MPMSEDTTALASGDAALHGVAEIVGGEAQNYASLIKRLATAEHSPSPASFDAILDLLAEMEAGAGQRLPDLVELRPLYVELQKALVGRLQKAARDIERKNGNEIISPSEAEHAAKIQRIAVKARTLAHRKAARVQTLTASITPVSADSPVANGNLPPPPPVDSGLGSGDDGRMEKRIEKLEADVAAIKLDLGIIKANGATKSDIAELRATISDAKTTIILWVVTAVVLAQILPGLLRKFGLL